MAAFKEYHWEIKMETWRTGEQAMNTPTQRIKMSRLKQYGLFVFMMAMTLAPSHAATVSFYMNESNHLPNGINYLSVNLTENLTGGVDVLVKTLDPLNDLGMKHFGMQRFAFSFDAGILGNITGLPDGWRVQSGRRMNGFEKSETRLLGTGNVRTDTLSFTVNDVSIDDFKSLFTVKVAGLDNKPGPASAFFGGSLENGNTSLAAVPVPASVWLLSSGLVGLTVVTRHRKNKYLTK
jgi:hypothetical protein